MKRLLRKILLFLFGDIVYLISNKIGYRRRRSEIAKKVQDYNKRKKFILLEKSGKERLSVLFFVNDLAMWRYEGLMDLLLAHARFDPIIVPFVKNNDDSGIKTQEEIIRYCETKQYPIRIGFDPIRREYLDISDIDPDIVVYPQPYDRGYEDWRIDNYIQKSLFIYTPYGISTSGNKSLRDTYLTNIAWKIFVSCQLEKIVYEESISIGKGNVIVTGTDIYDRFRKADPLKSPWRDNGKKRLIWAPHHSLDSKKGFSNSTFERYCDEMIEIAKRYRDKVEFAFKPHPALRERLIEKWGHDKTEAYYHQWETFPNTMLCAGNYIELFAFSDAMIHDCASFSYEYLITNKPVMFICNNRQLKPPRGVENILGRECFKCHYRGNSIQAIDRFIDTVVIHEEDPMKSIRKSFLQKQAIPHTKGRTASENMFYELNAIFDNRPD